MNDQCLKLIAYNLDRNLPEKLYMNDQHCPAKPLQAAEAALLADIEARFPQLACDGFLGASNAFYATPTVGLSEVPEQFAAAMDFIRAGAPGGWRRPRGRYSYGLKHAAEAWSRTAYGDKAYVSNGAMIAAAIASGWSVEPDGINAWLKPPARPKPPSPSTAAPFIAERTVAGSQRTAGRLRS